MNIEVVNKAPKLKVKNIPQVKIRFKSIFTFDLPEIEDEEFNEISVN